MKKRIISVLVSSVFMSGAVAAQDSYRLAYSKNDDIEIFIDGATKDNWCQEQLSARVQGGKAATLDGFALLLPKLGGLFAQQCPQTKVLNWVFTDAQGKTVALGQGTALANWAFVETKPEENEPVAVLAPSPAPVVEVPEPVAQVEPEPEPEPEPAPKPTSAYSALEPFSVGQWTPPTKEAQKQLTEGLSARADQAGCLLLTKFDLGTQDQYVRLESKDIACNADGYLHGQGTLQLMRSDGAALMRPVSVYVVNGIPFNDVIKHVHPDGISLVKDSYYWFSLGSNKNLESHYFIPARIQNHYGLGVWRVSPEVHVLAANTDTFKQAALIEGQINHAIEQANKSLSPTASRVTVRFADDVEKGLYQRNVHGLLYEVAAQRRVRRDQPPGEWQFSMQQASNYIFEREQKIAEEQQRQERFAAEEQRRQELRAEQEKRYAELLEKQERQFKAQTQEREARRQLESFRRLESVDLANAAELHKYVYKNVNLLEGGLFRPSYTGLLSGGSTNLSSFVLIDGKKDNDAVVSWPYEMRITDQADLDKGWYWLNGQQSLDTALLDKKGLPMTRVSLSENELYKCQQKQCAELQDPLTLYRLLNNAPDWTPEQAEQAIQAASAF